MNRPEGFDYPEPKTAASVIVAELEMLDVTPEPRTFSGTFIVMLMVAEAIVVAPFTIFAYLTH